MRVSCLVFAIVVGCTGGGIAPIPSPHEEPEVPLDDDENEPLSDPESQSGFGDRSAAPPAEDSDGAGAEPVPGTMDPDAGDVTEPDANEPDADEPDADAPDAGDATEPDAGPPPDVVPDSTD